MLPANQQIEAEPTVRAPAAPAPRSCISSSSSPAWRAAASDLWPRPDSPGTFARPIWMLRGRVVSDHLAQEVPQLTLFVGGETLKASSRPCDARQHPFAQPPSRRRQDDMLHAPVVGARPAGDESSPLEPVDEPGDVRVVARKKRGELGHRQRRVELKQSSRLRRVEVKLGGGDEKPAPVLSKESAKQSPHLGGRSHLAGVRDRLHSPAFY